MQCKVLFSLFFTNTSTTDIYTLSLHDALPIFLNQILVEYFKLIETLEASAEHPVQISDFVVIGLKADRKSTRLNSSHVSISYAVFCLKKKNNSMIPPHCDEIPAPQLVPRG